MSPGHGRHPPQVLQDHVIQHALPDIVGGAEGPVLRIGPAGKVGIGPAHGMKVLRTIVIEEIVIRLDKSILLKFNQGIAIMVGSVIKLD